MGKLFAFLDLFRKGHAVTDPAMWKTGQVALGPVIVALVVVLRYYKIDLPIDNDTAAVIGAGIVALVNVILTYATTNKIGILPERAGPPEPPKADPKPEPARPLEWPPAPSVVTPPSPSSPVATTPPVGVPATSAEVRVPSVAAPAPKPGDTYFG